MSSSSRTDGPATPEPTSPASTNSEIGPTGEVAETPPAVASAVFGTSFERACRYADLLCAEGVAWGLIGPREPARVWQRHLLNSAVVAELLPAAGTVVDVGSGAGLPGIPLALVRPDLAVVLVEPLLRRSRFLEMVVERLELTSVSVLRARAEELVGSLEADVVTARAVAPLDRLAGWTLPLAKVGGVVLAIRGARAVDEVSEAAATVVRYGGGRPEVVSCGEQVLAEAVTVVRIPRVGLGRPVARGPRSQQQHTQRRSR